MILHHRQHQVVRTSVDAAMTNVDDAKTVHDGGKACIAKYGCSGKSDSDATGPASSTTQVVRTSVDAAMTNVDDAKRFMMGVKHVLQNMAVVENLIVMQLVPHHRQHQVVHYYVGGCCNDECR